MQIYWFKAQAPRRVVALAKHLGIAAEFVEIDLVGGGLKQPTYARLNPNMKAPTLVDGEFVLWESSAIMAHLCIQAGSDMWPAHAPAEQVEVLRWLGWNDCHWSEAVGPFYFEHIIKPSFGFGEPDRAALQSKVDNLHRFARVLDRHLEGREFVACGRLTIADFHLASMATDWRASEMPLADFGNVVRWLDRLQRVPAWADPWPQQRAAA
ncbi:glutathione S-transferase [Nannocystis exedens]|uniref:Glutathione S-transferase n=1 Tax=Nannocystis exedens TaxID=54 RepID=A0A1I2AHL2_9BACT|nr:glutathione S-transferase family protein [Nannocystis exedens]PCC69850.1 glutathione S-transferase [Nannocystis exedens]SFE43485.1 glutathione S-transferase [Nannocystis exedens]